MIGIIMVAGLTFTIGNMVCNIEFGQRKPNSEKLHSHLAYVGTVSQVLFTVSLWIGLYTFTLFTAQPFEPQQNTSFRESLVKDGTSTVSVNMSDKRQSTVKLLDSSR